MGLRVRQVNTQLQRLPEKVKKPTPQAQRQAQVISSPTKGLHMAAQTRTKSPTPPVAPHHQVGHTSNNQFGSNPTAQPKGRSSARELSIK
jgi:hypothetical protein